MHLQLHYFSPSITTVATKMLSFLAHCPKLSEYSRRLYCYKFMLWWHVMNCFAVCKTSSCPATSRLILDLGCCNLPNMMPCESHLASQTSKYYCKSRDQNCNVPAKFPKTKNEAKSSRAECLRLCVFNSRSALEVECLLVDLNRGNAQALQSSRS